MGIAVPFFVNNKPSTRHVSRSLVAYQSDLMKRNFSAEKHQKITKERHSLRDQSYKNFDKNRST
jgi:hypothetical protein